MLEVQKKYSRDHKVSFLERQLSPREKSIFIYTKEGKDIAWISNTLGISSKTVWTHRRRAMDKLGVKTFTSIYKYSAFPY